MKTAYCLMACLVLGLTAPGFCGTHSAYSGFFTLEPTVSLEQPALPLVNKAPHIDVCHLANGVRFHVALPGNAIPRSAELEIHAVGGQLIKTFRLGGQDGSRMVWDGRNRFGKPVAPGVYVARLAGPAVQIHRVFVLLD
jgi:hypothetical protein